MVLSNPATFSRTPGHVKAAMNRHKCTGSPTELCFLESVALSYGPRKGAYTPCLLSWNWDTSIKSACPSSPRRWVGSAPPSLFSFQPRTVNVQLRLCTQLPLSLLELKGQMSSGISSPAYQQLFCLRRTRGQLSERGLRRGLERGFPLRQRRKLTHPGGKMAGSAPGPL